MTRKSSSNKASVSPTKQKETEKKRKSFSPTAASGRPKRRSAIHSPTFTYDREKLDKESPARNTRSGSKKTTPSAPLVKRATQLTVDEDETLPSSKDSNNPSENGTEDEKHTPLKGTLKLETPSNAADSPKRRRIKTSDKSPVSPSSASKPFRSKKATEEEALPEQIKRGSKGSTGTKTSENVTESSKIKRVATAASHENPAPPETQSLPPDKKDASLAEKGKQKTPPGKSLENSEIKKARSQVDPSKPSQDSNKDFSNTNIQDGQTPESQQTPSRRGRPPKRRPAETSIEPRLEVEDDLPSRPDRCTDPKSNNQTDVYTSPKRGRPPKVRADNDCDSPSKRGRPSKRKPDVVSPVKSKVPAHLEFPAPVQGSCQICPSGTNPFDDIFRHYAVVHSALYLPETSSYQRDTNAQDTVLRYTGKLVCQFCSRIFTKSGFGLTIHESRCLRNPKRNTAMADSFDTPPATQGNGDPNELINGSTYNELEEIHARMGVLKCNTCNTEYRSPVAYFVKHVKRCEKQASGVDDGLKVPEDRVSGCCIFCPVDRPPVKDMFRHYANEHSVLYTAKEPGWDRSSEALDLILRAIGKLKCQFCRNTFSRSGSNFLNHENRCPVRQVFREAVSQKSPNGADSDDEENKKDDDAEPSFARLVEMKQRDGFLTCSRCKGNYRLMVPAFIKHFQMCNGKPRKNIPTDVIESLASGKDCGQAPFECQICSFLGPFESAVLLQEHYMRKHAAVYSPDWPEGIKTQRTRDIIIEKFGNILCPKCNASYRLTPSFLYHEKVCTASEDIQAYLAPSAIADLVKSELKNPVKCSLCADDNVLAPNDVHKHYMEEHCAIYHPQAGGSDVLATKEAFDFIFHHVGHLRCDKCKCQFRCPTWFFMRHREICGVEIPPSDEDSESDVDSTKKKRRRAAAKALRRIGRMSDRLGSSGQDADKKDRDFEHSGGSSFSSDEYNDDSDASSTTTSKTPQGESFVTVRRYFNVRNFRDFESRQFLQQSVAELHRSFTNEGSNQPFSLPRRLCNLEPNLDLWVEEKDEDFVQHCNSGPCVRFDSDSDNDVYRFNGIHGTVNTGFDQALCYVGGRVYAMDSGPLRQDEDNPSDVWLAISAATSEDPDTRLSTFEPSVVQVWHVGVDSASEKFSAPPRLAYNLAIDSGPVLALQFCPVAPANKLNTGLLALGGSGQNLVSIVVLPSWKKLETISSKTKGPLVFRPSIALQLQISSQVLPIEVDPVADARRTVCMDWSLDGSVLAAAFNDASVAIWNFESNSTLFDQDGSGTSLLASRVIQAHSQPIVGLRVASFSKNAVITLSIDGALSMFNSSNGKLLNSLMSSYSTHLTLMPGSSLPVLVNNPWFVFRRIANIPKDNSKKKAKKASENPSINSSITVVDMYGESPVSDTWPFKILPSSSGTISCIASVKPMLPSVDGSNAMFALGLVAGTTSGDVTLYSTAANLLKIRKRGGYNCFTNEKLIHRSRVLENNGGIELIGGNGDDERQLKAKNPLEEIINPTKNGVTSVNMLQLPSKVENIKHANPRALVWSSMACGVIRMSFASLASLAQCLVKFKDSP